MKQSKRQLLSKALVIAGICLLACALVGTVAWQWNMQTWAKRAQETADTLISLLPQARDAVPEARRDNTMSTLCVNGTDFVGVIEMPAYSLTLPVGNDWGKTEQNPCRFDGSIYDGTMQIGASNQKGQFDFYREISLGDILTYTDMEGNRYTYAVRYIDSARHADRQTLAEKGAPLTIFIKNVYGFEYLIVGLEVR